MDLRPLDPLQSIKTKLGVLVGVTSAMSAIFVWLGLNNDLATRYTLPLAVALSLLFTQILARGMTSPLREMTAAAQAMARGDYSRRVRASSRDEVGQARERLQRDGRGPRRRRPAAPRASSQTSATSLRTPVSALRAVLENLVDGVTAPDDATLRAALAQTERLGDLVTQPARPVARRGRRGAAAPRAGGARRVPEHLRRRGWAGRRRRPLRGRRATRRAAGDGRPRPAAPGGRQPARQRHPALPAGGTVTASARQAAGEVHLDVVDEGPGIDPRDRERVFDRFHRGGTAQDGGTGLGLAIARWVVDLHGGTIRVLETRTGCDIRVALPR
ncbi:hypothetical protein GCM10025868_38340 [Angustibacter aerolatus]|uniref:Signal transduction histidine-protein kinase/phosphatase MprB n=1 Tax=Angustibacter aerolatus TaxID=1162965 RepID=A0ABQ6JMN0_9ACTN|nr:sensor histidine kinase [Angustibacter aerolatus]GMA88584.1 hypothetical protein GCM10025868_38340 [Angustibacter aerolatus]